MAAANDTASMALFCDFENIALGVRDAQYEKFDIRPVLERLLAKGSIVVKKAYCDWDRYKAFKAAMHEANFELIEIPHVRQSGKNSADIRMVVDALDLCYTKAHVDTFVIISGDSDFSPLVSKLRENAKKVIGVGVKQSCSDLLVTNCDEFIYYDDLVRDREAGRGTQQRREREKRSPEEEAKRRDKQEERKSKAIDIVSATFVDLMADRGESERIWASVLKEVVKRRNPGFNESYYGFRTFGNLLEEAAGRGLLGFGRDDKGAFVFRGPQRPPVIEGEVATQAEIAEPAEASVREPAAAEVPAIESEPTGNARRRGGRRGRNGKDRASTDMVEVAPVADVAPAISETAPVVSGEAPTAEPVVPSEDKPRRGRRPRKVSAPDAAPAPVEMLVAEAAVAEPKPAKAKRQPRSPRARKPKTGEATES
ncbi:NYN domain-containing protein [Ferribacterium limneticum]|uniref:NYN domain-containing protein n=1 Tax=Ferribacterium limneticum TaxID=76259 RepID=UPI001CFC1E25|nr:NYN domain-containing protein [Ferribacterium limneticum]UCV29459.1 NYN domain-containing protein [Ferribacterium limneticum]UCV33378.1 NYN domain-containing protein [Ferribacterium limneticum]